MTRPYFDSHRRGCPCDAFVEVRPGTELLPCPARYDALKPGGTFQGWRVAHRVEGSASTGAKVWSWWERAREGR